LIWRAKKEAAAEAEDTAAAQGQDPPPAKLRLPGRPALGPGAPKPARPRVAARTRS